MKVKVKYMKDGMPHYYLAPYKGNTICSVSAHVYDLSSSLDVEFLTQSRVIGVHRSSQSKLVLVP